MFPANGKLDLEFVWVFCCSWPLCLTSIRRLSLSSGSTDNPATMARPHGQISALTALISEASKIVEGYFAKSSKPYVPSLDDKEPHPLDEQLTEVELRTAIQTIEAACAQLSATVARPSHTVVNVR